MEIKGIIKLGETRSLTCCQNLQDITIDGVSLYSMLEELFNLDKEEYWNDSIKESPKYSVKYIILDKKPEQLQLFEELASETIVNMLYGEHISGCYSEWTCGYGGFDYVIGGHSIFKELEEKVNKYIHFII